MSRWQTFGGALALLLSVAASAAGIVLSPQGGDGTEDALATARAHAPVVTTLPPAGVGSLTCPGTADKDTTPSILVQSVDREQSSQVTVRYLKHKGATPKDERFTLGPGNRKIMANTAAAVLDWSGGPIQASVVDAVGGLNSRVNCATSATDQWDLVGFDTRLGFTSTLVLANPTPTPATASLFIYTPHGPLNLSLASAITVDPLNQTVINLADLVPELPAFAVRVVTSAGRVVASGELVRRAVDTNTATPTLGAVTGRARVVGISAPTDQSIIPALGAVTSPPTTPSPTGETGGTSSNGQETSGSVSVQASKDHQLIIANPNDSQVTVTATPSAPVPGGGALAAPIVVPGGSVATINMHDISTLPNPGLVVASQDGLPIVASVRTTGADLDITNGVNGASREWVVTGVDGAHIAITNPGVHTAAVRVRTNAGEEILPVGANAVLTLPSPVTGAIWLSSDLPIVASLRTLGAGWSIAGAALEELTGGGLAPIARRISSKVTLPALGVKEPLPVQPPTDLVPSQARPLPGLGQDSLPDVVDPIPFPSLPSLPGSGNGQGATQDPSGSTSEAPLPLPSGLPASPTSPPAEIEDEEIFG